MYLALIFFALILLPSEKEIIIKPRKREATMLANTIIHRIGYDLASATNGFVTTFV